MNQELTCSDCGSPFSWSEGEQKFYQEKGLQPPKRCRGCRIAKKNKSPEFNQGRTPNDTRHGEKEPWAI